jgi:hypothetical protein
MKWKLRQAAAHRGIWTASEMQRMLAAQPQLQTWRRCGYDAMESLAGRCTSTNRPRDRLPVQTQRRRSGTMTEIWTPSAGVLDHREHMQPGSEQGDRLEEVTGQQGLGLRAQENRPTWRNRAQEPGRSRPRAGSPTR